MHLRGAGPRRPPSGGDAEDRTLLAGKKKKHPVGVFIFRFSLRLSRLLIYLTLLFFHSSFCSVVLVHQISEISTVATVPYVVSHISINRVPCTVTGIPALRGAG